MRFRLSETDRKHYGCTDEWIYWDHKRFTNREALLVEVAEPDGPGLRADDWIELLRGEPVEVNGVPQIDEKSGEAVRAPSTAIVNVILWLGMRRAGYDIAWADWEYDQLSFETRPDEDLGKAESPAPEESPTPI